jgi:hypothetical protein
MFVVDIGVADSYVADNYVHIPSLKPIKFFSNPFQGSKLSNLLLYHLEKFFRTSGHS